MIFKWKQIDFIFYVNGTILLFVKRNINKFFGRQIVFEKKKREYKRFYRVQNIEIE